MPRSRQATRPGTATLCRPAPIPSSAWTGQTPQCSITVPAINPRSGSATNEMSNTSQYPRAETSFIATMLARIMTAWATITVVAVNMAASPFPAPTTANP